MTQGSFVAVIEGASKNFGAIAALDAVNLQLRPGEVNALVGMNGCGKSTLVKILAGYHQADGGVLRLGERSYELSELGNADVPWSVGTVHQDLGLIEELSILDNFLLPQLSVASSLRLGWKALRAGVKSWLADYAVEVPLSLKVGEASRVTRALLALARAVWVMEGMPALDRAVPGSGFAKGESQGNQRGRTGILILDEVTAFMSVGEVRLLRDVVRRVAAHSGSILFVSHDLDEVLSFADQVTVLRNGRLVSSAPASGLTKRALFSMIAGHEPRPVERQGGSMTGSDAGSVLVSIDHAGNGVVGQCNFEVKHGEVLGLAGLIGSGFDHIPYVLFGADGTARGSLTLDGTRLKLESLSVRSAIASGIALVPGDRTRQGLWHTMTIGENLLPNGRDVGSPWFLSWRKIWREGQQVIDRYSIAAPDARFCINQMSGGNAQRVLVGKWLSGTPKLLLLHEPVQGVDVGAREQISVVVQKEAGRGAAIICASNDHEYLADVCDRILVFSGGRISTELTPASEGQGIDKDSIVWACQQERESNTPAAQGVRRVS